MYINGRINNCYNYSGKINLCSAYVTFIFILRSINLGKYIYKYYNKS